MGVKIATSDNEFLKVWYCFLMDRGWGVGGHMSAFSLEHKNGGSPVVQKFGGKAFRDY